MSARNNGRGFTLVELAMIVVVITFVLLLLAPFMKQRWNADGLSTSLNNVRQLLVACGEYRLDHADRVPMRGTGYSNGQITGGWDSWNYAGKNCNIFWQSSSGGVFDEKAFCRFLNPYIQPQIPAMPAGHVNTGSGATWTYVQGTITPAQRLAYQVKTCRSPGDIATRQRAWPNQTPGVSTYDDVGTSYLLNMKWWGQPGAPAQFTAHYNAGTEKMRAIRAGLDPALPFAWINDSTADAVANLSPGVNIMGEFGEINKSVMGFLTGDAAYVLLTPGALSGPGYTFGLTWP